MRILCIQLKQLGDVLTTTPAVRALARHYPDCEIDFLTQRPSHTVYHYSPYVRHVYTVRWQLRELFPLLWEIFRRRYDLLVDFSGSSKTAVFSYATRIPRRIGFDGDKAWCFTDKAAGNREKDYAGARRLGLLLPLGIDTDDLALDFFTDENEGRRFAEYESRLGIGDGPLIAVSPVSKHVYKVWPAPRFAELCDRLIDKYRAQIFFLIGPGESHAAEEVQRHMQHETLPIDDSLDLFQAACLLDRSICYLGNDNGLMHLAIARKRPAIGIFGRHKALNWASPLPIQTAIEYDPGCKDSCFYPGCELECLTGITVDRVWRELELLLEDGVGRE